MRDRWERILQGLCVVLLGLMAYRVFLVIRHGPLTGLSIPAVPTLVETNAVASAKETNAPAKSASNVVASATNVAITNTATGKGGTNVGAAAAVVNASSNAAPAGKPVVTTTNVVIAATPPSTNSITNAAAAKGTNGMTGPAKNGTNAVTAANGKKSDTNGTPRILAGPPGFPGGPGMPGGPNKQPDLPPLAQGRVNKIIVSEIFAPMMHPQPAQLIGVAGGYAFLRSSSGQTGMVKEGDSLGGLKLLQVGINRALIEEDGEKKELMIFAGLGSETLMPKPKENTNDISKKSP